MIQQWKALLFASISVALGLSLALAIRLGTESAALNLKKNLEFLQKPDWVGPVGVHNRAAAEALAPFFARFPYRSTRLLDAFWVDGKTNTDPKSEPLAISILWGGSKDNFSHQAHSGSYPILYVSASCFKKRSSPQTVIAVSRQFKVEVQPVPETPANKNMLGTDTGCSVGFASGPQWLIFLKSKLGNDEEILTPNSISFYQEKSAYDKGAGNQLELALTVLAEQVPGLQFASQTTQLENLGKLSQSFNINLQLMGFIAIFIGIFMVHHVFSLIIAKNAQLIAILSAQGISLRKQVYPLFCVALCLGTIASIAGILLGLVLGNILSYVTQSTVQTLYSRLLDAHAFYWKLEELVYAFVLGIAAAFLGAAHPIFKIAKMNSAQVLKSGIFQSSTNERSFKTTLFIFVTFGFAIAVMIAFPMVAGRIPLGALGSCILILFLNALFASDFCRILYRTAGIKSLANHFFMALRIFMPPQTGIVLRVLCLGFALTIAVKSMAESFRQTLTAWVNTTLKADIWIRSAEGGTTPLPSEVAAAVDKFAVTARYSDIIAVDALRVLPAVLRYNSISFPVVFNGVRMHEHSKVIPLKFLDKNSDQNTLSQELFDNAKTCAGTAAEPCLAYISEALSIHANGKLTPQTSFLVEAAGRKVFFETVAIVQDFGSDSGIVMADISLVKRLFGENPNPSFMNLYLKDKSQKNIRKILQNLQSDLIQTKGYTLNLFSLSQLRVRVMEAFESTFRITDALYVLSAGIALVSVFTCLNLQLLLRRREWNIMWAIGIGRKRLRWQMALWAGHMALISCATSLLGGLSIAAILVYIVNYYSFGYSLNLALPWSFLLGISGLAWISGTASGWLVAGGLQKQLSSHHLQLE